MAHATLCAARVLGARGTSVQHLQCIRIYMQCETSLAQRSLYWPCAGVYYSEFGVAPSRDTYSSPWRIFSSAVARKDAGSILLCLSSGTLDRDLQLTGEEYGTSGEQTK